MPEYPSKMHDWASLTAKYSDSELLIGGWQVMQAWETPLMKRLAEIVAGPDRDVLEVGFGMGISAQAILDRGVGSYTVLEAHPEVAEQAREFLSEKYPDVKSEVVEGFWQDTVPELGRAFDGILFDTYPMTSQERSWNHMPFLDVVDQLLRPNGVATYYSDETIEFRAAHLHALLQRFRHVEFVHVGGLEPPSDCEYWKHDHMVIPVVHKNRGE